MEDTLGVLDSQTDLYYYDVLILVLMENTLGDVMNIKKVKDFSS